MVPSWGKCFFLVAEAREEVAPVKSWLTFWNCFILVKLCAFFVCAVACVDCWYIWCMRCVYFFML
jgi:hypothetical protein